MPDYFDDYDDFEAHDDYDGFDEDRFYDEDFERDIDDPLEEIGPVKSEASRTGLDWYEVGLLGALADELSEEKKRRRRLKKDLKYPRHKS